MPRQHWEEALTWATQDGTAVANTVTETIAFPDVPIPAGYMADGRVLRLTASGQLSTTGTPTLIYRVRWGGVAGTVIGLTETLTMGSGVTAVNWLVTGLLQTRSNGSSGSLIFSGQVLVHSAAGTVLQNVFGVSGFDAPAAVTADLSVDKDLSLTVQWGTASASNTLTGKTYVVESLN